RPMVATRSRLARQPASGVAADAVVARESRLPLLRQDVRASRERRLQRRHVRRHLARERAGWPHRVHDGERHGDRRRRRQHHQRPRLSVASVPVTHGVRGSALVARRCAMRAAALLYLALIAVAQLVAAPRAKAATMDRAAFGTSAAIDPAGHLWVAY